MRELTPVKTLGVSGNYSTQDLILQLMFYGDITTWRTARLMHVAEDAQRAGRQVLVLTENDHVEHLAATGFVVYRPISHGLNPEVDAAVIIRMLFSGQPIVINTNQIDQPEKNELTRHLVSGLAGARLGNLTLVVESTESFFPRRRSRGDTAGMDTMNNLLKRAKNAGAHVAFACESPEEIAVEIGRSCGTQAVGRISNHDRAKAVSKSVDKRLLVHADEIYGLKALNPNDFYLYNRYTAPRQIGTDIEDEIDTTVESLTQTHIVPRWLKDIELRCGFKPDAPTPGPDLSGDDQKTFETELEKARDEASSKEETKIAALAPAPVVANDNAPRPVKKRAVTRSRLTDKRSAVARISGAGVADAKRMYALARTILNARPDRLNAALDGRMTARSVATRVINDALLREAIKAGTNVCHRLGRLELRVSAAAYGAAYFRALTEDAETARAFHREMAVEGIRGGSRSARAIDMEAALCKIGDSLRDDARSEAQYQIVRAAWKVYLTVNKVQLPIAA